MTFMNRQEIIEAIIEAAREPTPKVIEIIQFEGSDGRGRRSHKGAPGITTTPQRRVVGYAFANPQGLLYGRIEHTRDALIKRHHEEEDRDMIEFRARLDRLNEAELKRQAALWLGHGAPQQPVAHTNRSDRQDRERDARLWYMMGAQWYQNGAGGYFLQMPRATLSATAARHGGWPSAPADRLDGGLAPRFHESHEAKHSLLLWLAERQSHILDAFMRALSNTLSQGKSALRPADYLCASPGDVAVAADEALRASGVYGGPSVMRAASVGSVRRNT